MPCFQREAADPRLFRRPPQGHQGLVQHPLITGDPESTHTSGNSMRGQTVSEVEIDEDDWDDYLIEETR